MQHPAPRLLSPQDLRDAVLGSTVLAAGGGGQLSIVAHLVESIISSGRPIQLLALNNVPPDAQVCTAYFMGPSSKQPDTAPPAHQAQIQRHHEPPVMEAVHLMQRSVGAINTFFPLEIGAGNLALAFYIASKIDNAFVVDADLVGRSVPELTHAMMRLDRAALPAAPVAAVNEFGETFLIENVSNSARMEHLLRALCSADNGEIAAVQRLPHANKLRQHLICGTVSAAMTIGRDMRVAFAHEEDVAQQVACENDGTVVFRGTVTSANFQDEGGFTKGRVHIEGADEWKGRKYTLQAKNENMAGWLDGELNATIPDIISVFDVMEGSAVINPKHRVGMRVAVVVLPAWEAHLEEENIRVFGPSYIGLTEPFKSRVLRRS